MKKVFGLKGRLQHYAWGGYTYIPDLLEISSGDGPYAEYWLGAHINAPALLETEEGEVSLDIF